MLGIGSLISTMMMKNSDHHVGSTLNYNPNRRENISIRFRDGKSPGQRSVMKFSLPARLSLPFHWWMMKQGVIHV